MANSASGLAERFLNLFVQVWLYQHLIKRISPEEYSLLPVVGALLVFVPPFLVILTSGLSRFSVEAHAKGDHERVTQITSTMFPVLSGAALAILMLMLVVTKYAGVLLKIPAGHLSEARLMMVLMLGMLALQITLLPFQVGLYVRQKFVVSNGLVMAQTVIRTALLFALLYGAGTRIIWVVISNSVADLFSILAVTTLSVRALPELRFRRDHIRWELLRSLMTFGVWNMLINIGAMIQKSSDLLILNRFGTTVDVDTFHLASLTDNQIDAGVQKIMDPVLPHMVTLHATEGVASLQRFTTRAGRYAMWAALFVATPLLVFRQQIWSHYLGSKLQIYSAVPAVMVLLLARFWLGSPVRLLGMATYATNRMRTLSLMVIASAITNVGITMYFVYYRHMGAVGSAAGTLVAAVIWLPLNTWELCIRALKFDFAYWFRGAFIRGIVPGLIALLFGIAWTRFMRPESIPELLLGIAIVATVYLLSILVFCLDEDERRQAKQLFAKVFLQSSDKAVPS